MSANLNSTMPSEKSDFSKPSCDLREFIKVLEEYDEVRHVKTEVDTNLEIGAITRRLIDTKGPAPLFENIKNYAGYRIFGLPFGPSQPMYARMALSFGMPKETPALSLINNMSSKLGSLVAPKIVGDSPCKEKILKGDNIDINKFPAPLIHSMDGGRYIGTWCIIITKDPLNDWTNWGVYRVMVHDSKTVAVNFEFKAVQHGADMLEEYTQKNTPNSMYEVAIVLGADPLSLIAAATSPPRGVSEASVAGALKGSPIELVKCETIDLEVPASAEVVIEGEVPTNERKLEGPMGEFTGYTSGGKRMLPYLKIKCITHRNDPVITFANMGKPWDDFAVVSSITYPANIKRVLQEASLPVKDVAVWPADAVVISVKHSEPDLAQRIMKTLKESKCRTGLVYTFIVGDDIDVTSLEDVFWGFVTRLHPKNGIHIESKKGGSPLVPHLTPEEREGHYSSSAYFDCTWPSNWTKDYLDEHCHVIDYEHAWPDETRRKVHSRWIDYGLS